MKKVLLSLVTFIMIFNTIYAEEIEILENQEVTEIVSTTALEETVTTEVQNTEESDDYKWQAIQPGSTTTSDGIKVDYDYKGKFKDENKKSYFLFTLVYTIPEDYKEETLVINPDIFEVIVNPIVAAAVPAKNVPIVDINKHILILQKHFLNSLRPLIKFAANKVAPSITIPIADITNAIFIKFSATGIKPLENKIPNITPIIMLIITSIKHPPLYSYSGVQHVINSPPLHYIIFSYLHNCYFIFGTSSNTTPIIFPPILKISFFTLPKFFILVFP